MEFLDFKPGLVGGHCIGVDPYYLTYKAQEIGYFPQIVLSGRRINDGMTDWITEKIIELMSKKGILVKSSNVLILGCTFKENCTDIRNSKVFELIENLQNIGMNCDVVDPVAVFKDVKKFHGIEILKEVDSEKKYDLIIGAVKHSQFEDYSDNFWTSLGKESSLYIDIKGFIPKNITDLEI